MSGLKVQQMVMGIGGIHEVVMGLFSAAEMDLFDQAGLHQMFERAVDGGLGNAKIAFAQFQEQFLGFKRAAELLHGLDDGEALCGVFQVALA